MDPRARPQDRVSLRRTALLPEEREDFNAGKITNADLVGVSAADRYTVRVELKAPTAFFIDLWRVFRRWRWCRARRLKSMATIG